MRKIGLGSFVRNTLKLDSGLGKVILMEGDDIFVYFKGGTSPIPEERVSRFALPANFLEVVTGIEDPDLDNLPPFTNQKFERVPTSLTLERAKQLFLRAFPLGFGDPAYLAPKGTGEREYKLAAHRRLIAEEEAGLG